VDGHDISALSQALEGKPAGKPRCLVAHTVKGKGVQYMEDQLAWHYRAPKTSELLEQALDELAVSYGREQEAGRER
jgi:transketolase